MPITREACQAFIGKLGELEKPRALAEHFIARAEQELGQKNAVHNQDGESTTNLREGEAEDFIRRLNRYIPIRCEPCVQGIEAKARAFFSYPPAEVTVCINKVKDTAEVEAVLTHELIHAIDHCTRGINLEDCEQLACSEIRASRESECASKMYPWPAADWLKRQCVRTTAINATSNMFPDRGAKCVNAVFDRCYADTVPFYSSKDDS